MPETIRLAIAKRLKEARQLAGLTQQDVATDFLLTRQAVSSWEGGKTMPSVLELRELALLYGVSTDRLLIGVDDLEAEGEKLLQRVMSDIRKDFVSSQA